MSPSHHHALRAAAIAGTGSYVPEKVLTNHELAKKVETSDEWIVSRTGIRERHIAAPQEAASDMGAQAARRALMAAGVKAHDVDMIVCASITPDMTFPSTACFIQEKLGAAGAYCFDVQAACSGFLYALESARQAVATGTAGTVLVVGAEKLSCILDWQDRATCVLFGDAAGAVVVQPAAHGARGILGTTLGADGTLSKLLQLPGGGSRHPASEETLKHRLHYLKMSGRDVFKHAVTRMTQAAQASLTKCGLTVDDIACIIPHQANLRIIEAVGDRLGGEREKYFVNVDRYGNTSAASVPLALDEAVRANRLKKGELALLIAFGGGFTWGATVLEW